MLYTSYISKIDNIPEEVFKLVITRYPPKGLNFDNDRPPRLRKLCLARQLAPNRSILMDYKEDNDWEKYKIRFYRQMRETSTTREYIQNVNNFLKQGKDIALICYEKDFTRCHRMLIAQHIRDQWNKKIWSLQYETYDDYNRFEHY